jgi:hypothetical protein
MPQDTSRGRCNSFFSYAKYPDWFWRPHSLVFSVYLGFSPGLKRPAREVDHSHLVPRLIISVAIPLLLLIYIYMYVYIYIYLNVVGRESFIA